MTCPKPSVTRRRSGSSRRLSPDRDTEAEIEILHVSDVKVPAALIYLPVLSGALTTPRDLT